ncbi:MAG: NUDIX domain-containing protein [Candidatus Riflebacteria bacterium]|nr:NUDIX domain-containing protein [Candidatus Riflebacteria bacterium]
MDIPTCSMVPGTKEPRHCACCGALLERRLVRGPCGETPAEHLVCTSCGEICWLDPKVAVGTLIEWQGGLVLLQRAIPPGYGKWVFPGGFMDRGETVAEAAVREAREEALVTVGDLELLGVYSYPGHPVILIAFGATVQSGTPGVGDETLDIAFCPLDSIPYEKLAFRSTVDAVSAFVARRRSGQPR